MEKHTGKHKVPQPLLPLDIKLKTKIPPSFVKRNHTQSTKNVRDFPLFLCQVTQRLNKTQQSQAVKVQRTTKKYKETTPKKHHLWKNLTLPRLKLRKTTKIPSGEKIPLDQGKAKTESPLQKICNNEENIESAQEAIGSTIPVTKVGLHSIETEFTETKTPNYTEENRENSESTDDNDDDEKEFEEVEGKDCEAVTIPCTSELTENTLTSESRTIVKENEPWDKTKGNVATFAISIKKSPKEGMGTMTTDKLSLSTRENKQDTQTEVMDMLTSSTEGKKEYTVSSSFPETTNPSEVSDMLTSITGEIKQETLSSTLNNTGSKIFDWSTSTGENTRETLSSPETTTQTKGADMFTSSIEGNKLDTLSSSLTETNTLTGISHVSSPSIEEMKQETLSSTLNNTTTQGKVFDLSTSTTGSKTFDLSTSNTGNAQETSSYPVTTTPTKGSDTFTPSIEGIKLDTLSSLTETNTLTEVSHVSSTSIEEMKQETFSSTLNNTTTQGKVFDLSTSTGGNAKETLSSPETTTPTKGSDMSTSSIEGIKLDTLSSSLTETNTLTEVSHVPSPSIEGKTPDMSLETTSKEANSMTDLLLTSTFISDNTRPASTTKADSVTNPSLSLNLTKETHDMSLETTSKEANSMTDLLLTSTFISDYTRPASTTSMPDSVTNPSLSLNLTKETPDISLETTSKEANSMTELLLTSKLISDYTRPASTTKADSVTNPSLSLTLTKETPDISLETTSKEANSMTDLLLTSKSISDYTRPASTISQTDSVTNPSLSLNLTKETPDMSLETTSKEANSMTDLLLTSKLISDYTRPASTTKADSVTNPSLSLTLTKETPDISLETTSKEANSMTDLLLTSKSISDYTRPASTISQTDSVTNPSLSLNLTKETPDMSLETTSKEANSMTEFLLTSKLISDYTRPASTTKADSVTNPSLSLTLTKETPDISLETTSKEAYSMTDLLLTSKLISDYTRPASTTKADFVTNPSLSLNLTKETPDMSLKTTSKVANSMTDLLLTSKLISDYTRPASTTKADSVTNPSLSLTLTKETPDISLETTSKEANSMTDLLLTSKSISDYTRPASTISQTDSVTNPSLSLNLTKETPDMSLETTSKEANSMTELLLTSTFISDYTRPASTTKADSVTNPSLSLNLTKETTDISLETTSKEANSMTDLLLTSKLISEYTRPSRITYKTESATYKKHTDTSIRDNVVEGSTSTTTAITKPNLGRNFMETHEPTTEKGAGIVEHRLQNKIYTMYAWDSNKFDWYQFLAFLRITDLYEESAKDNRYWEHIIGIFFKTVQENFIDGFSVKIGNNTLTVYMNETTDFLGEVISEIEEYLWLFASLRLGEATRVRAREAERTEYTFALALLTSSQRECSGAIRIVAK
ncbi:uncharacterized protein LOC129003509 [Macrosteles quadrilineatus]|uniref:uncharacterized protein LOC129003509 n=1 Tax=Macrosteles quadrilineatus TaxID=74068 RepID=UPI0023E205ED|nr:uncharacterized protein LOC129003509 [Macrosteles quadrilineatus]